MAVEVTAVNGYKKEYLGTNAEMLAMDKTEVSAGSTFYCWDTQSGYIFATGAWRPV
jgi:hypothetical protein